VIWLLVLLAAAAPKRTPQLIERGRGAYAVWCIACHGPSGAGDGPSAASLDPRPRNFREQKFKQGARVQEIFRTLGTGVPGTMMKPFTNLSDEDRWALAYYVLELKAGRP
jgi:mono/diheme cytochrome c family protein